MPVVFFYRIEFDMGTPFLIVSGKIAVIGGCREYTGAPYFAAISALKIVCVCSFFLEFFLGLIFYSVPFYDCTLYCSIVDFLWRVLA